ncbi:hypothetical protein FPL06_15865 [Xanthomonas citri pv. glycines]|uniref:hypothetical protein n=1 Tax=Xanthomonas citri TaxID=346 RepID=UPI001185E94B|nr:hypothetical protein [Xanthomonas citri]TSK01618.1 hypothetical protein FPL06_15865 [Xanthomonas citri pv. glycines]
MKNAWIGLAALASAVGLTACSGKPSNANAKQALTSLLEQSGAGRVVEVRDFELSGCTAADGADGYRCDTRGQVMLEIAGRHVPIPVNKSLRYAKADGVWRAYTR